MGFLQSKQYGCWKETEAFNKHDGTSESESVILSTERNQSEPQCNIELFFGSCSFLVRIRQY